MSEEEILERSIFDAIGWDYTNGSELSKRKVAKILTIARDHFAAKPVEPVMGVSEETFDRKLYFAVFPENDEYCFARRDVEKWKHVEAVARDHLARREMTKERRGELLIRAAHFFHQSITGMTVEQAQEEAERRFVEWGVIPPRPVPSLGERFAAEFAKASKVCIGDESGKILAKMFDEVVGPLVELANRVKNSSGPGIGSLPIHADDVLANLEEKMGGK